MASYWKFDPAIRSGHLNKIIKCCLLFAIYDIITHASFGEGQLRGFGVTMGRIFVVVFLHDLLRRHYNTLTLLFECVMAKNVTCHFWGGRYIIPFKSGVHLWWHLLSPHSTAMGMLSGQSQPSRCLQAVLSIVPVFWIGPSLMVMMRCATEQHSTLIFWMNNRKCWILRTLSMVSPSLCILSVCCLGLQRNKMIQVLSFISLSENMWNRLCLGLWKL